MRQSEKQERELAADNRYSTDNTERGGLASPETGMKPERVGGWGWRVGDGDGTYRADKSSGGGCAVRT